MKEYVIVTDSCCDLSDELARSLDVRVLPLSLHMDGRDYRNYLDGRELSFTDFYARLRAGETATTSAVSVGDFQAAFRALAQEGKDVLCLSFSSALSTTYQSAAIAAEDLSGEFPDWKCCVVDTLCASLGQGLLVYLCAQRRLSGAALEEVRDFALETKDRVCHWFTVDDLNHLKRGGRVSSATALFGTMLAIKPVLHVDDTGHLIAVSKTRGRRAALLALVERFGATASDPGEQTVFISHGDCLADAELVADELRRRFGVREVQINYIGPVVGNHAGPGTVALFFLGSPR